MLIGNPIIPPTIEIALIKPATFGLYPGLYLYNDMARFIRPVKHLKSGKTEFIGPLEQIYMNIAVTEVDIRENTTHIELSPTNIFSFLADLTPFSDFNQSPRNMYQCQVCICVRFR
jgi:DNA-directed RNA polymerase I subunit RPA2